MMKKMMIVAMCLTALGAWGELQNVAPGERVNQPNGPGFALGQNVHVGAASGPVMRLAADTAPVAAPVAKTEAKVTTTATNETSLADQTDIEVTVYNSNLGLVRDRRKVKLQSGELSLKFMDVAQQIRPETVSLRSISDPGKIAILEQNYEYDLMSPAKLMEKYVGKPVQLLNFSKEIGFEKVDAELLSINDGPVYKVNNQIYLGHPGTVVLPQVPENLIAKPSLIWQLQNSGADQDIEVTYLTGGINWNADYVVTLDKGEAKLDLAGWVTLNNQSGATYTNAQLKLVAGEVNLAPQPQVRREIMEKGAIAPAGMAPPPMKQEAFGEYHLYTLPRRTTIKQNQAKQVSLLTATAVGVKKIYEYRGDLQYFSQPVPPMKDQKVGVYLKFANKKDNQLGMPLPAGVMRVYQEDSDGMLQFSGEDRIQHTPKDEDVRIKLGNAFDVVGER
ncbi:MAG: hypothetical protein HZB26_17820, partial [Candidatus Hydrogenedentes bacterium]|nr:hypothetical protein [Candidatus Hydrogenedentota bacterium]